jgi:outer membrane murein-binding lipoprotein Lpp
MQRVQAFGLLMLACASLVLAGCNDGGKVPTVAEYLHDVDAMKAKLKEYQNNPSRLQSDPAVTNASAAASRLQTDSSLIACWDKSQPRSTATTNHECLDAKGLKR